MSECTDTPEYLRKEILSFRKMMGSKKHWELSDDGINRKIDLAFKGLFHIYLRVKNISEDDRMHIEAIVIEFEKRKFHMEMEALKSAHKETPDE